MDVRDVSRYRPVMCSKRCCGFSTQVRNGTLYRWRNPPNGKNRYSRMKNRRSPIANWIRPRTFRCNTTNCCRSAAFSASSRLVDLSGEINRLRKRDSRPPSPRVVM